MGVPVLTLQGQCHAHNVGVSLMAAIGLREGWVATSEAQYLQLAVGHASNIAVSFSINLAWSPVHR